MNLHHVITTLRGAFIDLKNSYKYHIFNTFHVFVLMYDSIIRIFPPPLQAGSHPVQEVSGRRRPALPHPPLERDQRGDAARRHLLLPVSPRLPLGGAGPPGESLTKWGGVRSPRGERRV